MDNDERYPAGISPVVSLAEDYKSDLDILRKWNPMVINPSDIERLRSMCIKHGMDDTDIFNLNKDNFFTIKGYLMNNIIRKYEQLTQDILERNRQLTPGKRPREVKQEKTEGKLDDMYK
jgi:hypothetical protein